MGNEFIVQDVQVYVSTVPQPAINVMIEDGNLFIPALVDAFPAVIPQAETIDDADQVGDASEFPRFVRLYRWALTYGLGTRLNTEIAALLIARALGGDITTTAVTPGESWDHEVVMQRRNQGRIPKASTIILPNAGGADFIFGDMCVDSWTVQQNGDAQPTATFNLIGSGLHKRLRNMPALADALPDPTTETPEYHYFHGAALGLVFTDQNGEFPLADTGRVKGYSIEFRNNIVVDRRVGDRFIGTNPGSLQVETATVAGTILSDGTVITTVTAAGMTNSPKAVSTDVLTGDTAAEVAAKIRRALERDGDILRWFQIAGSGNKIVLIRRAGAANDATMNIALANGTATGLTAAATSYNTSAGVASANTNDVRTGSYAKNIIRGRRSTNYNYEQTLDEELREYDYLTTNQEITETTFINKGDPINATEQFELEIRIPRSQTQTIAGGTQDPFLTIQNGMLGLKDTVTEGVITMRVRNDQATLDGSALPSFSLSPSASRSPSSSASASLSPSGSRSPSASVSPSASPSPST